MFFSDIEVEQDIDHQIISDTSYDPRSSRPCCCGDGGGRGECWEDFFVGFRMGFDEDQINYHGIYIIYNM